MILIHIGFGSTLNSKWDQRLAVLVSKVVIIMPQKETILCVYLKSMSICIEVEKYGLSYTCNVVTGDGVIPHTG